MDNETIGDSPDTDAAMDVGPDGKPLDNALNTARALIAMSARTAESRLQSRQPDPARRDIWHDSEK